MYKSQSMSAGPGALRSLCAVLCFFIATATHADAWQLIKADDGIQIAVRNAGTRREVRAWARVRSTPAAALALLRQIERGPEWIHFCKSARIVASPSRTEFIAYSTTSLPFPLRDRDAVMRMRVSETPGQALVEFRADPEYIAANPDYIRVTDMHGSWTFRAIPEGLYVLYEFQTDPGGLFPDWFVNRGLAHQPFNTLSNLRRLLEREQSVVQAKLRPPGTRESSLP